MDRLKEPPRIRVRAAYPRYRKGKPFESMHDFLNGGGAIRYIDYRVNLHQMWALCTHVEMSKGSNCPNPGFEKMKKSANSTSGIIRKL